MSSLFENRIPDNLYKPLLFLFLSLLIYTVGFGQDYVSDDYSTISNVHGILQENHIEYSETVELIGERFSVQLIQQLDSKGEYLLQSEKKRINELFLNLEMNPKFILPKLKAVHLIFLQAVTRTSNILDDIDNISFFEADSFQINVENKVDLYKLTEIEQRNWWIKKLKYKTLIKHKTDSILALSDEEEINKIFNQSLQRDIDYELCKLAPFLKDQELKLIILNAFLRAYCLSFDPHSDYLSSNQQNIFISQLSTELYSSGIYFSIQGSTFYIDELSPYSHANTIKEINIGDEITGVLVNHEMLAPACISTEKLINLFYGKKTTSITIEIKSLKDDKRRIFTIPKSVISNNFNHTFHYVFKDATNEIGYIQFPSFYSKYDFDSNSSAEDLALILLDFKQRGISNIIVDLRNNGGGSIDEAVELLGYFIDYGPLFSITSKEYPDGYLFKDMKRGKVTTGKTVFLVNGLSASASELVAGTMQKYPDALIVGSSTFGKATGQNMMPLPSKKGIVLVTTIKIHSLDGSNYQVKGVEPDVVIPTYFSKPFVGEAKYDYPIRHKRIRSFREVVKRDEPIDSLKFLSSKRNSLQAIEALNDELFKKLTQHEKIPLNYYMFTDLQVEEKIDTYWPQPFDIVSLESNDAFMNESNRRINNLHDPILGETFLIFKDWLRLTKKP